MTDRVTQIPQNFRLLSFVIFTVLIIHLNNLITADKKNSSLKSHCIASCVIFLFDYITLKLLINGMQFLLLWSNRRLRRKYLLIDERKQVSSLFNELQEQIAWSKIMTCNFILQKNEQIQTGSFSTGSDCLYRMAEDDDLMNSYSLRYYHVTNTSGHTKHNSASLSVTDLRG